MVLNNSSHLYGETPKGWWRNAGLWTNLGLEKWLALKSTMGTCERSRRRSWHWTEWEEKRKSDPSSRSKAGDKWPEPKGYVHTYGKRVRIPMTPSSRLWCLGRMIKPLARREGMHLGRKKCLGASTLTVLSSPFPWAPGFFYDSDPI